MNTSNRDAATLQLEARMLPEDLYRCLFEEASDGIFVASANGRYVAVNARACELTGYAEHELLSMSMRELVSPGDLERTPLRMDELLDGRIVLSERALTRKDGAIFMAEISARRLSDGRLLGLLRDISARKRDDAEREALRAELTQARKLDSIGRLTGGIAHDFNNMLTVILAGIETSLHALGPEHPQRPRLLESRDAALRSAELTRRLLTFARKQPLAPKVLDVNARVEGTLQLLRRLLGVNVTVQWTAGREIWPIFMDPAQLDQVLTNLTVNATDAIADTGTIRITTSNVAVDARQVAGTRELAPGDYVKITVSDTGAGMRPEVQARAFEPFFTTKAPGHGTGLGLATVYSIVKQSGGAVDFTSEPGRGTTFEVFLPRFAGQPAVEPPHASDAPLEPGLARVLLVEDEPSVLGLVRMLLRQLGYTVLAARSPDEALRLVSEEHKEIDLVLADIQMPKMNGIDLVQALRAVQPELKCVFMSGHTLELTPETKDSLANARFLSKPFSLHALASMLRASLLGL